MNVHDLQAQAFLDSTTNLTFMLVYALLSPWEEERQSACLPLGSFRTGPKI